MDILLGCFAQKYLHLLSEHQLQEYEKIIDLDDDLLYSYVVGRIPVPSDVVDAGLIHMIANCMTEN